MAFNYTPPNLKMKLPNYGLSIGPNMSRENPAVLRKKQAGLVSPLTTAPVSTATPRSGSPAIPTISTTPVNPTINTSTVQPIPVTMGAPTSQQNPNPPIINRATSAEPTLPQINPALANQPTPPPVPTTNANVTALEKALSDAAAITPEEDETQRRLDATLASTRLGSVLTEGQPIPMQDIQGQQAQLESQGLALAEPLEQKLARLQAKRLSAVETSKFALERADKASDVERETTRDLRTEAESNRRFGIQQGNTEAERALAERKFEEDKRQFGLEYALSQRELGIKETEANEKAGGGAGASSDLLNAYNLAGSILSDPSLSQITGVPNPFTVLTPGTSAQYVKNQYNQLKGFLALENRQKLKGSGAISDFESKTLERAASALGRNLSDADFKRELAKVRGVLGTAAGLEATVAVTDPNSGETKVGPANRDTINSAIASGYLVEYQ